MPRFLYTFVLRITRFWYWLLMVISTVSLTMVIFNPAQASAALPTDNGSIYSSSIVGSWQYIGYRYQGTLFPPQDLNLVFTFSADGTNRLHYERLQGSIFCERTGHYTFQSGLLEDHVDWLDPNNSSECFRDPDMQIGRNTKTRANINADSNNAPILELNLLVGEDPVFYLLKKISKY